MILTRPEGRNERLGDRLRHLGFRLVVAPLIAIEPIETGPVELTGYDWLILTSATGARELRRRAVGRPTCVAAIGRATAEAWGERVDLVPAIATQEGLLDELSRPLGRVLFAGAEDARRLLVQELVADFVALYRTRAVRPTETLHGDLVVLASPSAAMSYAALQLAIAAVTIGPETTRAAVDAGVRVLGEAETQDLEGVVSAVLRVSRLTS